MKRLTSIEDLKGTIVGVQPLYESLDDAGQTWLNEAIISGGPIPLTDGTYVDPKEVVKCVKKAIDDIAFNYRTYYSFVRNMTIIYVKEDPDMDTMCVDNNMNMYIDMLFVAKDLEMNHKYVVGIIMHEIFHIVFNHIERGRNWLASEGKQWNKQTGCDNNLAADIEVNTTLYLAGLLSEDELKNIHALFLPEISHDIVPMENTLENEERMNKLRNMVDYPWPRDEQQQPGEGEDIKTTPDWDEGFKEAYGKLAEIINTYGPEKARDMLRSAGIIGGVHGNINPAFDADALLGLHFINIKTWEDFFASAIVEANSNSIEKDYTTKHGGMVEAVRQVMDKLNQSLNGGGSGGSGGSGPQQKIESGVDKKDLPSINLPKPEGAEESKSGSGNDLTNINWDDNQNDDNKSEQDGQEGQEGKEGQESGDSSQKGQGSGGEHKTSGGDANKIANHIAKNAGYQHGSKSIDDTISGSSVGHTGTFIDSRETNVLDRVLERSGYSPEQIKKIKDKISKSQATNSAENIRKKKEDMYKGLSKNNPIKKMLERIAVEEEKYKNIWKKIMEDFLKDRTRRAGKDVRDKKYKWGEKRRLSIGMISPKFNRHGQEPQDINVFVDVSGSMDIELYRIIVESLVVFCNEYKYSGINVIPWASHSNGIHRVESLDNNGDVDSVAQEICGYISQGASQCGGGTSLVDACGPEIISIVTDDEDAHERDHVYIIITDGQVGSDTREIENYIIQGVASELDNSYGEKAVENCFWMVYDADQQLKEQWERDIKKGTCVFLNTKVMSGEIKSKN